MISRIFNRRKAVASLLVGIFGAGRSAGAPISATDWKSSASLKTSIGGVPIAPGTARADVDFGPIDPRRYNAVLDGIVDDTAPMQAAIDAAIARPGAVVDLGGRTAYCGALLLPNCRGLSIRNGYIKVKGDAIWMKGATGATSITFLELDNIFFDCSEHTTAGRALIDWSKFTYSVFRRLWVYTATGGRTIGFYAKGDGVVGPYYNLFEMIYGGGLLAGIQLASAATVAKTVNNNEFRNCRFTPGAADRTAIVIGTNNQQNRIQNCVFEDTVGGTGVYDNGIGTQIKGTRFEGLTLAMQIGANAAGGYDDGSYFDSNLVKRRFDSPEARLLHNSFNEMDGSGNPADGMIAGGLRLGGGQRWSGNAGFPGNLQTGEGLAYSSPTLGGAFGGYGSTNDITLLNRSGMIVARVPTNTQETVFEGPLRLKGYTVATLPAAGIVGRMAYVTDAKAPTYLGALVGGGAVRTPVFDNGTAWVSR